MPRPTLAFAVAILGLLASLLVSGVAAQTVSGTVSGTVLDSTGQSLPGASVTLTNEETGADRSIQTGEAGAFLFAAVQPGRYTVRIELSGFTSYERKNVTLPPNEQLSIGSVELSLGSFSETVTTTAQGSFVQTVSSDRSATITDTQLESVAVRGRDVVSLLRTLPGVSWTPEAEATGAGVIGTATPNIGGTRNSWNTVTVDGLPGNDLGLPAVFSHSINFDAVEEVKVQLNNYTAESGRNGGAQMNMITKSGTQIFKGSGYGFKRHERWNATDFFNNMNGIAKPLYRFTTLGATLGGPALPMKGDRNNLFFFYAFENWDVLNPLPLRQVTVPTELERMGDFSQSRDLNGNLIIVRDPFTRQPYPANRIPAGMINRNGQALLNIFPRPNALDASLTRGIYNYTFQESQDFPRRNNVARVDFRPTSADAIYGRFSHWYSDARSYSQGASTWGLLAQRFTYNDYAFSMNYTRVLSSRLVNELSVGRRSSTEANPALNDTELNSRTRSAIGYTLGQFNPAINEFGLMPMMTFGGFIPNAAPAQFERRFVNYGADTFYSINEALSWSRGRHNFKAGLYFEYVRNREGRSASAFSGLFDFSRDPSNPLDTGHPYANALSGVFASYTEQTSRPGADGSARLVEWFVQDSWRATPKLTAEIGIRLGTYTQYAQRGASASFVPDRFDAARAPRLYAPALVDGVRVARDPATGATGPAVLIGGIVPGSGDINNGMVLSGDPNYPRWFKDRTPLLVEPRLGMAYDVFGDGKTALRANFGVFHNTRQAGLTSWEQAINPPLQFSPSIFYGTMDTFLQSTGVTFPGGAIGVDRRERPPVLYSITGGIQQAIGWGTVVDVAYVGTRGRNLPQLRNLNTLPFGARFLPQNQDPTRSGTPLPDAFLRPYRGYGDIRFIDNSGVSDYNALQVSVNRRYTQGVQFGLAYTLSRSRDFTSSQELPFIGNSQVPIYRDVREWTYGLSSFDQTHVAVINYTWELPRASARLDHPVVAALLDNWTISGLTSFASGTPAGINFTTVDNADILGGGDAQYVCVVGGCTGGPVVPVIVRGNPKLERGERSLERWFDTSAFARPARGEVGNGRKDMIRLPGVRDTGIVLTKRIPVAGPTRFAQFRWEIYNVFNTPQYNAVDTTARFDIQGNQVNRRFGQVFSTRPPRVMQFSLRFTF